MIDKIKVKREIASLIFKTSNLHIVLNLLYSLLYKLHDNELRALVNVIIDAYMEAERDIKELLNLVDGPNH